MGKSTEIFVCDDCGAQQVKWFGQCPSCNSWGSLIEGVSKVNSAVGSSGGVVAQKIKDVDPSALVRFSSGYSEFDRVLGGSDTNYSGFVNGQVVLLSGDPGIGKSTLLLRVLESVHSLGTSSLYVSAEESVSQIYMRAQRLFKNSKNSKYQDLDILSDQSVENIISVASNSAAKFIIIDSIQTVYSDASKALAGGMAQIKLAANKLISYAKNNGVTLILVGHINKAGIVAGPKVLEHLVDTVVQLEGDEKTGIRTLRSLKNRFGHTFEVGMFTMEEGGLMDLSDPSRLFEVGSGESAIGVCKSVVIEGVRPIIVEVQTLTAPTPFAMPKRVSEGFSTARLQRILAILSKYTKLNFSDKDVYAKVSSGLSIKDPGLDLAIALALMSSLKDKKIKRNVVAFGELGLTGKVMGVVRLLDREKEGKRLGYSVSMSASVISNIKDALRNTTIWEK